MCTCVLWETECRVSTHARLEWDVESIELQESETECCWCYVEET